eukprot:15365772-Ditylum_brightwellii.AAC.1
MEKGTHNVKEFNSDIDSISGTSHIWETENFYNTNKSGLEREESTLSESEYAASNASTCLSEGVQAATVISYAYGLRSFSSVMPEVLSPVLENLSCENATSIGMQDKNILADVTMLPLLDVPITDQKTVYSDVEMPHVANKRPNSVITRA